MILKSIEIEKFRCFRHSKFENFSQVNLIGGKNNAGKTALLEALLLANMPTSTSILFLDRIRDERTHIFYGYPDLVWTNLFYLQDKKNKIQFYLNFSDSIQNHVSISYDVIYSPNLVDESQDLEKIQDSTASLELVPVLNIESKSPTGNFIEKFRYRIASFGIDKFQEFIPENSKISKRFKPLKNTLLIPTGYKKPSWRLSTEFEKVKLMNGTNDILKAFQIIDNSIINIDTINLGEPRIYIYRKDTPPQPLNFFGDALNKIADLILRIYNNPNCILLIDEIENGIHHTNQKEFWSMLIKLAIAKDVQIFATSHSAEMINAFQTASVDIGQEESVRYIELYKSRRTDEIVGDVIDMETLIYDIKNKNSYRGEE